jgi:hypothetical protein
MHLGFGRFGPDRGRGLRLVSPIGLDAELVMHVLISAGQVQQVACTCETDVHLPRGGWGIVKGARGEGGVRQEEGGMTGDLERR